MEQTTSPGIMEDLIELIDVIKKTKFKSIGAQHLVLEPGSQAALLYEGMAKGLLRTDEDVQRYFEGMNLSMEWLTQLKSKLRSRLLDMLLLLDLRGASYEDRGSAYAESMRKWACVTILLHRKARASALSLLEDLLRSTQRFEFTEITVEILRLLSLHQGLVDGNPNRFGAVEAMLEDAEALRMAEYKIERLYLDLVNKFVRKKAAKEEIIEKSYIYLLEVEGLMQRFSSYEIHLYGRLIELVYWDARNDQAAVVRLAQAALDFFQSKPYYSQLAMQAFYYYLMVAQLNLRQHEGLAVSLSTCKDIFDEGTHNWFKLKELEFLHHMQTAEYPTAQSLYDATVAHKTYTTQAAPVLEMWKIFEAWLAFLAIAGCLPKSTAQKFKISKFMNEVSIFSRDKSGMNVAILVLQFLHYLIVKDYGSCIDRVDALTRHRQRYLRAPSTVRSQYFVRMLELIPRCHFSRAQVECSCTLLFDQLQSVPFLSTNQNHEVEILPYETVWHLILTHLPVELGNGEGA